MTSGRQESASVFRMPRAGVALTALLVLLGVTACGGDHAADIPPQTWGGLDVRVESRPSPPHPGMNEFLVLVTDARGRPGYDLIVSLRTSDDDAWTQAIEDGQVGVYRRAVKVAAGTRSVLQVRVRRRDTENTLYFPLQVQS